jgi:hypothetical protein
VYVHVYLDTHNTLRVLEYVHVYSSILYTCTRTRVRVVANNDATTARCNGKADANADVRGCVAELHKQCASTHVLG